jgi:hypothetical protein
MKFNEFPRAPADKPGGGGEDDEARHFKDKIVEAVENEAQSTLVRFFTTPRDIGKAAPALDASFTDEEFIERQFRLDQETDRKRGLQTSEKRSDKYTEAIQQYLDILVQDGFLSSDSDEYRLTEKGRALIPSKH